MDRARNTTSPSAAFIDAEMADIAGRVAALGAQLARLGAAREALVSEAEPRGVERAVPESRQAQGGRWRLAHLPRSAKLTLEAIVGMGLITLVAAGVAFWSARISDANTHHGQNLSECESATALAQLTPDGRKWCRVLLNKNAGRASGRAASLRRLSPGRQAGRPGTFVGTTLGSQLVKSAPTSEPVRLKGAQSLTGLISPAATVPPSQT